MIKSRFIPLLFSALIVSFTNTNTHLESLWNELLNGANFDHSKQSFCFEEQGTVFGKNIDLQVKPASVTKLYTTLWSLDSLGKDFRFQTKVIVKNNNLYLVGGSDPFFVTENLLVIMDKLERNGFTSFNKVYFSEDFLLNWSDNPIKISATLRSILNTSNWNQNTQRTFKDVNDYIRNNTNDSELSITKFEVKEIIPIKNIRLLTSEQSFLFKSSPLWQHFKQVNMYSNNFYTDKIFDFLGGNEDFSQYINNKLSVSKNEIYFYTGSGLGNNYTTCRTTLKMLNALETVMQNEGILHEEVIAVPGFDDGTLVNRFTENHYRGKLTAKTGTLRDTSTLAGYLFDKETIKFGVFNHTFDRQSARVLQDKLIKAAIDNYTSIQHLNYQSPTYISIKDIEIIDL